LPARARESAAGASLTPSLTISLSRPCREIKPITSALTFAEAAGAIVRARVAERLGPDAERAAARALRRFERRCYVVSITDDVLARVRRPFPVEPVRTLNAVHLATAESLGELPQLITIVTRDDRVRDNAKALGYSVE
jgi:hypothetical protein